MPDDRRERSPGRRDSDRILDALWRELDSVERSRERDAGDMRRELERLEASVDRLERHLDSRVDELEEFHIGERAKIGERVRERTVRAESWAKISIIFGVLGVLWGVAVTVFHL